MKKNHLFIWQGVNRARVTINGQIEALDAAAAKALLRKQGIRVCKLHKSWFLLTGLTRNFINSSELTIFNRQLATLINAGVSLSHALNIMLKNSANKQLQNLLIALRNDIQTGIKFCDAAAKYPQYFSNFFCSLVRIGEETGSLAKILGKLADHQEKNQSLKRKISKALFYPSVIILVAIIVAAILLLNVVPQFQALFATFNAKLPAFTLFVINLATFVSRYRYPILGGILMLMISFILAKCYLKSFNLLLHKITFHLPILGTLIHKAIIARLSYMLAITFSAGMPLVDSLRMIATTAESPVYANKILTVCRAVSIGGPLYASIEQVNLFPAIAVQMIAIGEETGKLDEMLNKVATMYTEEVDTTVAMLSSLIEPLVMIIVGMLVGGLVVAMYLPIFKLGSII